MNIKKIILILTAVFVITAVPVFSKQTNSETANNTSGKVQVLDNLDNRDECVWVEFSAREEKNDESAGGFFHRFLDDNSRDTYADVVYVKVDGEYAWFAGKCVMDSAGLSGRWFFAAVHDGGAPGRLVDHIWWDWLPQSPDAETIAAEKVENLEKPANNKPIKNGNIVVKARETVTAY